jgi:hypothetical protein
MASTAGVSLLAAGNAEGAACTEDRAAAAHVALPPRAVPFMRSKPYRQENRRV